jgi:hypothetical protein
MPIISPFFLRRSGFKKFNIFDELYKLADQVPTFDLDFTGGVVVNRGSKASGNLGTFTRPSSSKLVWNGSQFVSVAADTPALQRDPVTGVWGVLMEPAATNLLAWSRSPVTGIWPAQNVTYSESVGTWGDGSNTVWRSQGNAGSADKRIRTGASLATTGTFTASWILKANTERTLVLRLQDNTAANGVRSGTFSFDTGDFTSSPSTIGSCSGASQKVTLLGDEVYLISLTGTFVSGNSQLQTIIHHDVVGSTSSTGIIEGWNAQLEVGSLATSPIITAGSTVTRNADVWSFTGTQFSDWYDLLGGAYWAYMDIGSMSGYGNTAILSMEDGTTSNRSQLRRSGSNDRATAIIVSGGVVQSSPSRIDSWPQGAAIKSAASYGPNDLRLVSNPPGTPTAMGTSVVMPTGLNQLRIGTGSGANIDAVIAIKRIAIFPGVPSDAVLNAIVS